MIDHVWRSAILVLQETKIRHDMKTETIPHPLKAIRRAGVPLAAIETADPRATIVGCIASLNGSAEATPIIEWDCVRGINGLNKAGVKYAGELAIDPMLPLDQVFATLSKQAKDDALLFAHNLHRFVANDAVMQSVWNLRDTWKPFGATCVMLCPAMSLPIELQHDVVVLTEALPDAAQIRSIVQNVAHDAEIPEIEHLDKVVDTLLGVSAFAAEQAFAMSCTKKDGVDRDGLWERKRKMVEQTPGLSVWRDRISFEDVGGLTNIKGFLTKLLTSGKNPVRCIGFIDEIEKLFAGAAGDTSGVSQDQLRVFLTEMQDSNIPGIILVGPPGTGKSLIAKCAATVCDGETLSIDTGAMTGSLVGESQAKIRKAMATFKAVSQGKGLFIATCNKIAGLPPELRRRFKLGTFYVDLPSAEERKSIWRLKTKKFAIADKAMPEDEGWTGAEIEACCDIAYRCDMKLAEAAEFIVPVSKSAADQIDALRKMASGRFISASKKGIYQLEDKAPVVPSGRKFGND